MEDFSLYFNLGWQHILDWQGYDHILFVMVLCGTYIWSEWRKILVLVTAFTLGHSITLACSVLNLISINSNWVEFLIPVTIFLTAISNIIGKKERNLGNSRKYTLAMLFGLIHGLGFSNYLKSLLGKSSNIVPELLAFNVGLEFGQMIIVAGLLILSFFLTVIVKIKRWDWNFFLSSAIFGIAFVMAAQRLPSILN
ncbi:MAG: HupE/UreJ family protein [Bacteroidota bacterium]